MIVAHAKTLGKTIDSPLTNALWYVSFYAPVLFFFSFGSSLVYQLRKYGNLRYLVFLGLLFLISFADLGRSLQNYFAIDAINLFGSLAGAGALAWWLRRHVRVPIVALLIPIVCDRMLNRFALPPTLLHGVLFGVLPWTSFVIFGTLLHTQKKFVLWSSAVCLCVAIVLAIFFGKRVTSQDSTTLYLLLGFASCGFSLLFARVIQKNNSLSSLAIFAGKHSLLFYWVHLMVLTYSPLIARALIVWVATLLVSLLIIFILKKLILLTPLYRVRAWVWSALFALILVPLYFQWSLKSQTAFFYGLLILFALMYPVIVSTFSLQLSLLREKGFLRHL